MIEFRIEGDPRGKQRPRHTRSGIVYTPSETVAYEKKIKAAYYGALAEPGAEPGTAIYHEPEKGPMSIEIDAGYPVPKGYPKVKKKNMLAGYTLPTKKPDLDNVVKIIMDALNGEAYVDDRQVVEIRAIKQFSEVPGVVVRIGRLRE